MPLVSTTEPEDFTNRTKMIITTVVGHLMRTFRSKVEDQDLVPFSIFILMRTFMLAGIARFHHAPDEQYQDAILYRGIYSGLKLSCTKRKMEKILPECYSTMLSPDIAATLINNHFTLIEPREYMESIPSVATSPTYKVFLFKQLAQMPTWASKYQDHNLNDTIMEYHLRLLELSRRTTLSLGLHWLSALSINRSYRTDKILDYLDSRDTSEEKFHVEIDELLSEFQVSKKLSLSMDNRRFLRRAQLKVLLTEHFESISHVYRNLTAEKPSTESPSHIAAYKSTQRRQDNPQTTTHCPHRENHPNCAIKKLNPQDWVKGYKVLYYYACLNTRLRLNCTFKQSESTTLDNLITEGNFGRTKFFVHQIFGDNNFEPNKSFRRQIDTPFISQKSKWNGQCVRDKPAQPEKDF